MKTGELVLEQHSMAPISLCKIFSNAILMPHACFFFLQQKDKGSSWAGLGMLPGLSGWSKNVYFILSTEHNAQALHET